MGRIFDALNKSIAGTEGTLSPTFTEGIGQPAARYEEARTMPTTTLAEPAIGTKPLDNAEPYRGRVCDLKVVRSAPVLPFDGSSWEAAEQYRMARTRIIQHPRQPRSIVISSADSGDGKSTTSINLAGALGLKIEGNVLLVDADVRRGNIARVLGLPSEPGLTGILTGQCTLDEALITAGQIPRLSILTSGKSGHNPVELLDSPAWVNLTAELHRRFRYVIYDSPPIGSVADFELIQAQCDGVVIVVRPDHTVRKKCLSAIRGMPKQRLLGVIVNCASDWIVARMLGHGGRSSAYSYYS